MKNFVRSSVGSSFVFGRTAVVGRQHSAGDAMVHRQRGRKQSSHPSAHSSSHLQVAQSQCLNACGYKA